MTIPTNAPELHAIRWETLVDPSQGTPLLMQDNILFSRFLSARISKYGRLAKRLT
jgi:hypothetical protein